MACAVLTATGGVASENWPQWRGPFYNGSATSTNLPATWSKSENVVWSVALPGPGAATPIIWERHVFISSTDAAAKTLQALAIDRATGAILWQQKIADAFQKDRMSNYASPSPVTDGKLVVFFYGNGDLAAFDLAGTKLWSRNLQTDHGDFAFNFTFAASPTLDGGRLYLQVLQRDVPVSGRGRANRAPGSLPPVDGGPPSQSDSRTPGSIDSFLLALDPATGRTLWRQVRPSEAVAESREAYTTPIPHVYQGRRELLIAGGDCLTGHDPETGRELWRWGTWNPAKVEHWRLVPSPVAGAGVVLVCAPKGSPVYAIKAGGTGVLPDSMIAWKSDGAREVSSDVPTPLFYLGDFFVLNDLRKALTRVEPGTGQVKWTLTTPGQAKYEASPIGADGRLFLMNFKGEVAVVDAADGKVLQQIPMGEEGDNFTRSSIAIAQGQLFIRTNHRLFCVGRKPAT